MAAMTRTIRVFVCSLVSDTRGESAVLETDVFPLLRERLMSHGYALEVVFSGLDTHSSDTMSESVLSSDFKTIDECRPFFIAILGERYGCPPDAIPTNLLREQRWILDYADRSMLELEILHAVLRHPQAATGSFFFFRDPRTILAVPRSERNSLLEDTPESAERLANLKDRIRQSGHPILDNYPSRWDADSRQMGELGVFAERVRNDLSEAIVAKYPELTTCLVPTLVTSLPASPTKTDKPNYVDEDVQFTVFRPKTVRPDQWYDLVAAAHLEEKRETADDEAEPLEKVRRKAKKSLGAQLADYKEVTRDSTRSVPQGGEITFLFEMDKVEFNPYRCTFQWLEDEHTVDVRMRASRELDGRTATGQMSVFLGTILLADVPLKIKVDGRFVSKEQNPESEPVSARPYRKIFASYSHQDLMIVEQFERFAEALGDRYLRDWKDLRAGENWDARLMQLIDEADVFQLFWSCHAMESQFVRREWEYALGLGRSNFVRPVYWEQPFPRRRDLPTADLARLHFQQLTAGVATHLPAASSAAVGSLPASRTSDSDLTVGQSEAISQEEFDDSDFDLDDLDTCEDESTQLKADEVFQRTPSATEGDADEEDSGIQVIALEDSEAFGEAAAMPLEKKEEEPVLPAAEDELEGELDQYEASPAIPSCTAQFPTEQTRRSPSIARANQGVNLAVRYGAEISRPNPTCLLFLVDQSGSMRLPFGREQTVRKADAVADAINRLLYGFVAKCTSGDFVLDRYYIGVFGYGKRVGSALGGELAGQGLVPVSAIATKPLRLETRLKRLSDGAGGQIEVESKFPIWLDPVADRPTRPMCEALREARKTIESFIESCPTAFPPIVINITDGAATDGDPEPLAAELRDLTTEKGNVLLFNVHISSKELPPIELPVSEEGLPDKQARLLYRMSSPVSERMIAEARSLEQTVPDEARGFVFNADLVSVIQFLDIWTRTGN